MSPKPELNLNLNQWASEKWGCDRKIKCFLYLWVNLCKYQLPKLTCSWNDQFSKIGLKISRKVIDSKMLLENELTVIDFKLILKLYSSYLKWFKTALLNSLCIVMTKIVLNPNKTELFEGSFFWVNLTPPPFKFQEELI